MCESERTPMHGSVALNHWAGDVTNKYLVIHASTDTLLETKGRPAQRDLQYIVIKPAGAGKRPPRRPLISHKSNKTTRTIELQACRPCTEAAACRMFFQFGNSDTHTRTLMTKQGAGQGAGQPQDEGWYERQTKQIGHANHWMDPCPWAKLANRSIQQIN